MAKRGPRTPAGKTAVSRNAVTHGLSSSGPLIVGIEHQADWDGHRAGLMESFAPDGKLEEALAELLVSQLWRLPRVPSFEADQIAITLERIDDADIGVLGGEPPSELRALVGRLERSLHLLPALPGMPDNARLSANDVAWVLLALADENTSLVPDTLPGVEPACRLDDVAEWDAGLLRECMAAVAENVGASVPEVTLWAAGKTKERLAAARADLAAGLREADRQRRSWALPDDRILERVTRYEAHLYRRFFQTLHELEALQARRRGEDAPLTRLQVHGLPGA
jgi:hypothetical protein